MVLSSKIIRSCFKNGSKQAIILYLKYLTVNVVKLTLNKVISVSMDLTQE